MQNGEKIIYIDYTRSIPRGSTSYHGGANYTNHILAELQKSKYEGYKFILLWPKGYTPRESAEESLYNNGFFIIQEIESLSDVGKLEKGSTLFTPVIDRPIPVSKQKSDYSVVRKIKKENPTVYIIATIFDMRWQYNGQELLDRYYFSGKKYYFSFIHKSALWVFNNIYSKPSVKRGLPAIDKVFTISNFSLQQIIAYNKNAEIIPHYLSILDRKSAGERNPDCNYFLFVSGNRPIKNFLRTLSAFCDFKKTDKNNYYLYVTGLNEQTFNNLQRYKKIDKTIVRDYVRVHNYVDDETLDSLYKNCSVFLYTSKYEGFGLPILEAAKHGRPSISSFKSSIPEVLGCAAYYINPSNISSIQKGMVYMTQEHVLKQYETWVSLNYPILEQKMKLDFDVVLEHLGISDAEI